MLKLVFYFNHYTTLGHSTRVFSLVRGLKASFKENIEIIVLQGGKKQDLLPFNNYSRTYILPYSISKRGFFIEENTAVYKKMVSNGKLDKMLQSRLLFIRNILDKFKPDIFLTEYFPFGQEFWTFEIPYILRYLKDNFSCKIMGSCGYLSWIENTYEYVKEFYDAIFIHSPEEFSKDYNSYLHQKGSEGINRIFADFSDKIFFTGFVLESYKTDNLRNLKTKHHNSQYNKLILVSRGGGIVNKKIVISSILVAKRNKNLFFIICCGPATSSVEFMEYRKLSKGISNLVLNRVMKPPDFNSYLKASDLSINMAGYNTTTKLLFYGKKTILIPFYTLEQKWRADLVKKYLPSRVIQEKELNVSSLEKEMLDLLDENKKAIKINKAWFSGVLNTVKKLKCMV